MSTMGTLALRVRDEEVVFKLPEAMKLSMDHDNTCYSISTTNNLIGDYINEC